MSKSLAELHRQRGQLIERIAHQRATLAREATPLKAACDATDHVLTTVRITVRHAADFVRQHPAGFAGLVAAAVVLKPRRLVRWLGRAFLVWRSWRSLRGWLPRW